MLWTLYSNLKNVLTFHRTLEEGDQIPEFQLKNQDGRLVKSSQMDKAIIFFYPRALTPGCTREACNFQNAYSNFEDLGWEIYGISTDNIKNQRAFHDAEDLEYDLLADPEGLICSKFGVIANSGMAKRITFIVKNGVVRKKFKQVDPDEHVEEVLNYLEK